MVTQTPQAPALAQLSAVPRQATARLRAAAKQTPGQLTWMLAVLVVLSVLLGVVGAIMVTHK
ncbi:MAG: hypothetical protein ACRDQ1_04810, partial [Sciscionella sp.]